MECLLSYPHTSRCSICRVADLDQARAGSAGILIRGIRTLLVLLGVALLAGVVGTLVLHGTFTLLG